MKYTILSLLIVCFTFTYAQEGKVNKGEKYYRIYTSKSLLMKTDEQQNFYAEIAKGNNLVFEYYMRADERADMTDDEYMEKIMFEVPKTAKSFNYTGIKLKAAFLRGCFCADRGWHEISDGFIKGKKISTTTWQVEMDVMTKADPERNANAVTKKMKVTFKVYTPPATKKK